jgi:uncharacterized protein DUF6338
MDLPTKAVIDFLTYLLPGFVAAAVVYSLTPAPRPSPFERIVQALIFTIFVQVTVVGTKHTLLWAGSRTEPIGIWDDEVATAWSVLLAIGLGLLVAWAANTDKVHNLLRQSGLTYQTSYPSEWYGALCQNKGFVVLHLTGERRLFGWAEEWPSTPNQGHFVVAQAEWLDGSNRIELIGVQRILVRGKDVEMVELMQPSTQEKPNGRSQATDTTPPTAAKNERTNRGESHDPDAASTVQAGTTSAATSKEVATAVEKKGTHK